MCGHAVLGCLGALAGRAGVAQFATSWFRQQAWGLQQPKLYQDVHELVFRHKHVWRPNSRCGPSSSDHGKDSFVNGPHTSLQPERAHGQRARQCRRPLR